MPTHECSLLKLPGEGAHSLVFVVAADVIEVLSKIDKVKVRYLTHCCSTMNTCSGALYNLGNGS